MIKTVIALSLPCPAPMQQRSKPLIKRIRAGIIPTRSSGLTVGLQRMFVSGPSARKAYRPQTYGVSIEGSESRDTLIWAKLQVHLLIASSKNALHQFPRQPMKTIVLLLLTSSLASAQTLTHYGRQTTRIWIARRRPGSGTMITPSCPCNRAALSADVAAANHLKVGQSFSYTANGQTYMGQYGRHRSRARPGSMCTTRTRFRWG